MFFPADIEIDSSLPPQATYWMPDEEDLDEDGIGYFHNTWLIIDIPRQEAANFLINEYRLARVVEELATDPNMFESLAEAIEGPEPEYLPENLPRGERYEGFLGAVNGEVPELECLELGVAGLVYSLASAGCVPAASCRGHVGPTAWSDHPVVYVAADRARAEWLQPLVERAGCGFGVDPERPNLLVIQGPSIEQTLSLARLVLIELGDALTVEQKEALSLLHVGPWDPNQQALW